MRALVELARSVHDSLAPAFRAGLHPSQAMSGALAVVDARGENVLFQATANYNRDRGHVELQLMGALFLWTRDVLRTPFILPPGCSVNLYVFNSPCQACAKQLAWTIGLECRHPPALGGHVTGWGQAANRMVQWRLGFTRYYLGAADGYDSSAVANLEYAQTLGAAGWQYGMVEPADAPAPAAAAPAAAAGARAPAAGAAGAPAQ